MGTQLIRNSSQAKIEGKRKQHPKHNWAANAKPERYLACDHIACSSSSCCVEQGQQVGKIPSLPRESSKLDALHKVVDNMKQQRHGVNAKQMLQLACMSALCISACASDWRAARAAVK